MPKFINTELKLDSESDLDSDLEKTEAKFDGKLESDSDNDSGYDTTHWFFYFHGWPFYLHVFDSFELITSFLGIE